MRSGWNLTLGRSWTSGPIICPVSAAMGTPTCAACSARSSASRTWSTPAPLSKANRVATSSAAPRHSPSSSTASTRPSPPAASDGRDNPACGCANGIRRRIRRVRLLPAQSSIVVASSSSSPAIGCDRRPVGGAHHQWTSRSISVARRHFGHSPVGPGPERPRPSAVDSPFPSAGSPSQSGELMLRSWISGNTGAARHRVDLLVQRGSWRITTSFFPTIRARLPRPCADSTTMQDCQSGSFRRPGDCAVRRSGRFGGERVAMHILWVKMNGLWPSTTTGGRVRSLRTSRVGAAPGDGRDHAWQATALRLKRRLSHCHSRIVPMRAAEGRRRVPAAVARSWMSKCSGSRWREPQVWKVRSLVDGGTIDLCVSDFLFAAANVPAGRRPSCSSSTTSNHDLAAPARWRRAVLRALFEIRWRKSARETDVPGGGPDDSRVRRRQSAASKLAPASGRAGVNTTTSCPMDVRRANRMVAALSGLASNEDAVISRRDPPRIGPSSGRR